MVSQDVHDIFDEYVFNELPTHLLYVPRMKVMGREEVQMYLQPAIEGITEEEIMRQSRANLDREQLIKKMVKARIRYAIFSHRWLRTAEPTFQDVTVSKGKLIGGAGYAKLKEFCKKAKEFGCDFVWSDTCCIDKTSSAELDEAIRSMFRWYRNAYVCIAFLADSSTIADFDKEAWFRRGWTLQELLAPKRMKFFGKGWIPFSEDENDKKPAGDNRILLAISGVTKIPATDLTSFQPGTDRVREKMSWASKRRTTRIEDVAYSLIGMFDVSLMVAYGEGNRAFYRLLEAIIQRSNVLDIFQWRGEPSPYNAALPASPSCYPYRSTRSTFRPDQTGDKLFALTNDGLRLKVLLVRVTCHRASSSESELLARPVGGTRTRKFVFSHKSLENVVLDVVSEPQVYRDTDSWALGVIDYWHSLSSERGSVEAGNGIPPFTAFLLHSYAMDMRWKKVKVDNVIEVFPKEFWEGDLVTLYLK